mmetsp:Transcript_12739/g.23131  ORF Transcript_12739/g.23131 Transcript_12739/m.23131 type:complete len:490 (+) Transcript_12739:75-1544(+)
MANAGTGPPDGSGKKPYCGVWLALFIPLGLVLLILPMQSSAATWAWDHATHPFTSSDGSNPVADNTLTIVTPDSESEGDGSISVADGEGNFEELDSDPWKSADDQKHCQYDTGTSMQGEWKSIEHKCKQLEQLKLKQGQQDIWNEFGGYWCLKRWLATNHIMRPPNPRDRYYPKHCRVRVHSQTRIRKALAENKLVLIGDSTMYEQFLEIGLRFQGPEMAGRYVDMHKEPDDTQSPLPGCIPQKEFKRIGPSSEPCFRMNLNNNASYVDIYSLPMWVFRDVDTQAAVGFVTYKTDSMYGNFGGAGAIAKNPLKTVVKNAVDWGNVIVVNSMLHSMGNKRHIKDFQNNWTLADAHFNSKRDTFKSELETIVLPIFRTWINAGKHVIWWSGNHPASIGSRPLLQTYYQMFLDTAREAIAKSNQNHPKNIIRWVDTSYLSQSGGHNTSQFTDGVHFGAWAILPTHKAQSSLVSKMTAEMILDAVIHSFETVP